MNCSRSPLFFAFVISILFGLIAQAQATVVLRVGLEEMTHASDVVFQGQVEAVDVLTPSDGPITTRITLRAHTILKGADQFEDGLLQIHLLGGRGPDHEIRVPGMPQFAKGEKVVLFLEKTRDDFALTGLQQGVFRIQTDPKMGEALVSRNISGIVLATFDDKGRFSIVDSASQLEGYPLLTLLDEVRFYLGQSSPAKL